VRGEGIVVGALENKRKEKRRVMDDGVWWWGQPNTKKWTHANNPRAQLLYTHMAEIHTHTQTQHTGSICTLQNLDK